MESVSWLELWKGMCYYTDRIPYLDMGMDRNDTIVQIQLGEEFKSLYIGENCDFEDILFTLEKMVRAFERDRYLCFDRYSSQANTDICWIAYPDELDNAVVHHGPLEQECDVLLNCLYEVLGNEEYHGIAGGDVDTRQTKTA